MKSIARLIPAILAVLFLASCADKESESYREKEQRALDAWIAKYVPNAQKLGDYGVYYEVITPAPAGAESLDTEIWVDIDFTLKDLSGNVVYNRHEDMARRQGTFTKYTYYSPDFLYLEPDIPNLAYMQGMFYGLQEMKVGEVRRFYIPSHYGYKDQSFSNSVGYGGQYNLSANKPLILDNVEVLELVPEPEEREKSQLEDYISSNWGMSLADSVKDHLYMRILKREADSAPLETGDTARIFYTGKFLDDFAFDTNIDTVWLNKYGQVRDNDVITAITMILAEDENGEYEISTTMPNKTFSYILPDLRIGDSIQVALISKYAYYYNGRSGSRTTSSSNYSYDYYDYYGYGNYGYGYSDYSSYMSYMMNSSYGSSSSSSSAETITEVKAYCPLVYTIVVYPPERDEDDDIE